MDEAEIVVPVPQLVTIGTAQRRAGDHDMAAFTSPAVDIGCDGVEPGPAVGVRQRHAGTHLVDIRRRMERISVAKGPTEPLGQQGPDGRLAATRDAHHDDGGQVIRGSGIAHACIHSRKPAGRHADQPQRSNRPTSSTWAEWRN
jgi:hypothetical protein